VTGSRAARMAGKRPPTAPMTTRGGTRECPEGTAGPDQRRAVSTESLTSILGARQLAVIPDDAMKGDGLLPPEAYARHDESPDDQFYSFPRKVVHIDEEAIGALGRLYAERLPPGGRVLDLMSSWRSHLPEDLRFREVVGLGMNAEEMAENPQLTRSVVHDLNRDPRVPFGDDEFDGAVCAVSIQYMTKPLPVFREVRRVLRPGAPFVVSFSNRCFPTKAVAVWLGTTDRQHVELVRAYFEAAGGWADVTEEDRSRGDMGDPLHAVWARTST